MTLWKDPADEFVASAKAQVRGWEQGIALRSKHIIEAERKIRQEQYEREALANQAYDYQTLKEAEAVRDWMDKPEGEYQKALMEQLTATAHPPFGGMDIPKEIATERAMQTYSPFENQALQDAQEREEIENNNKLGYLAQGLSMPLIYSPYGILTSEPVMAFQEALQTYPSRALATAEQAGRVQPYAFLPEGAVITPRMAEESIRQREAMPKKTPSEAWRDYDESVPYELRFLHEWVANPVNFVSVTGLLKGVGLATKAPNLVRTVAQAENILTGGIVLDLAGQGIRAGAGNLSRNIGFNKALHHFADIADNDKILKAVIKPDRLRNVANALSRIPGGESLVDIINPSGGIRHTPTSVPDDFIGGGGITSTDEVLVARRAIKDIQDAGGRVGQVNAYGNGKKGVAYINADGTQGFHEFSISDYPLEQQSLIAGFKSTDEYIKNETRKALLLKVIVEDQVLAQGNVIMDGIAYAGRAKTGQMRTIQELLGTVDGKVTKAHPKEAGTPTDAVYVYEHPEKFRFDDSRAESMIYKAKQAFKAMGDALERNGIKTDFGEYSGYVHRIVKGLREGTDIKELIRSEFSGNRLGSNPSYRKRRFYEDIAEGLASGRVYEDDLMTLVSHYIRGVAKEVSDHRVASHLKILSQTIGQRMSKQVRQDFVLARKGMADYAKAREMVRQILGGYRPWVTRKINGKFVTVSPYLDFITKVNPELGARVRRYLHGDYSVAGQPGMRQEATLAGKNYVKTDRGWFMKTVNKNGEETLWAVRNPAIIKTLDTVVGIPPQAPPNAQEATVSGSAPQQPTPPSAVAKEGAVPAVSAEQAQMIQTVNDDVRYIQSHVATDDFGAYSDVSNKLTEQFGSVDNAYHAIQASGETATLPPMNPTQPPQVTNSPVTADSLRLWMESFTDATGRRTMTDKEIGDVMKLVEARATAVGESLDEYIGRRIAGFNFGQNPIGGSLLQNYKYDALFIQYIKAKNPKHWRKDYNLYKEWQRRIDKARNDPASVIFPNDKTLWSLDAGKLCPNRLAGHPCFYCYVESGRLTGYSPTAEFVFKMVDYEKVMQDIPPSVVDFMNDKMGGLRVFSFGDYMPEYRKVWDNTIKLATDKKLRLRAITKNLDFVDEFAKKYEDVLGIDISLDGFMEMPMAREKLPSLMSNAPAIDKVLELRKKHPNVRSRILASNPPQVEYFASNPDIDIITYYHGRTKTLPDIVKSQYEKMLTEQQPWATPQYREGAKQWWETIKEPLREMAEADEFRNMTPIGKLVVPTNRMDKDGNIITKYLTLQEANKRGIIKREGNGLLLQKENSMMEQLLQKLDASTSLRHRTCCGNKFCGICPAQCGFIRGGMEKAISAKSPWKNRDAVLYQRESMINDLGSGEPQGAIAFNNEGKATLQAFQNADVSTAIHELAHLWRRDISVEQLEVAEKWLGVKDHIWDVGQEEKFARGFEKYIRTGKAEVPALKGLFESLQRWMMIIYRTIKGSDIDIKIPPNVSRMFDSMFVAPAGQPAVKPTEVIDVRAKPRTYDSLTPQEKLLVKQEVASLSGTKILPTDRMMRLYKIDPVEPRLYGSYQWKAGEAPTAVPVAEKPTAPATMPPYRATAITPDMVNQLRSQGFSESVIARMQPEIAQMHIERVTRVGQAPEKLFQTAQTTPEGKEALKGLLKELDDIVTTKKADLEAKELAYRNELRLARTPKLRGIGGVEETYLAHPAFGGRIFPKSVQVALDKYMADRGSKILSTTSEIAGILRSLRATADFSYIFMQLLPVLASRPDVWAKAVAGGIRTWFSPAYIREFRLARAGEIQRRVGQYLGYSGGTEFFERPSFMGRVIKGAGKVGEKGESLFKKTIGRFGDSYSASTEIARELLWDAWSKGVTDDAKLFELARRIDRMTGVMSIRQLGLSKTKQQILSSFVYFAPRYIMSGFSLMWDVLRGKWGATESLKMLNSLFGAGLAMYAGTALALGQEPQLDPTKGHFMQLKVGDNWYGFGGVHLAIARLAGDVVAHIADSENHERVDLVSLSRQDNPFIKFLYGRTSTLTSLLGSAIERRDYFGQPFENVEDYVTNLFLESVTPIALSDALFDRRKGDILYNKTVSDKVGQLVANQLGLRTSPRSLYEVVLESADDYAQKMYGKNWKDLDKLEAEKLKLANPQIKKAFESAEKQWETVKGGIEAEYNSSKSRIDQQIGTSMSQLQARWEQNPADGKKIREDFDALMQSRRMMMESMESDPKYKAMLTEWDDQRKKGTENKPFNLAYYEYTKMLDDPKLVNPQTGEYDFKARERLEDEFVKRWGRGMSDKVKEYLNIQRYGDPPVAHAIRKAREVLKPYWKVKDDILDQYGLKDAYDYYAVNSRFWNQAQMDAYRMKYPNWDRAMKLIELIQNSMRRTGSPVEEALVAFYGHKRLELQKR